MMTNSNLGNIESKIEFIRKKIDECRRLRLIQAQVDSDKTGELKEVKESVGLTTKAIGLNKGQIGEWFF